MKRLLLILATLAAAVMASAQGYSGAMNILDRDATITNRGVAAVENVASETPGLQLMIEQSIQTNLRPGDLQVVQKIVLPKGCKYLNSGLDRKKLPFQHYTTAKGGETAYVLKSKTTGKTVTIKDKGLNPIQVRVPAVPLKQTIMETTWNVTEIDINISINNNVSSSATATASTAPINITFY